MQPIPVYECMGVYVCRYGHPTSISAPSVCHMSERWGEAAAPKVHLFSIAH